MPASIVAKVLPLLFLVSSIAPASISPRIGDIVGTSTSWEVDANMDDIIDGNLHVDNVTGITSPVNLASDLRCVLTWDNISIAGEIILNNAMLEWMGLPLVLDSLVDTGELHVDFFAGVNREFIPVNVTFNGDDWTLAFDKITGLMLGMYQENGTNLLGPVRKYYIRISSTTVFFNPVQVEPYMIWVAIAVTSFAVVYTVSVTARDKKLQGKRACFREGCW